MTYLGYAYETVEIGGSCFFAENCRALPQVSPGSVGAETDNAAHVYVYGYSGNDIEEAMQTEQYLLFGALYNRLALQNLELCPSGWHVATYTDYTEMRSQFQPDAGPKLRSSPEDDPPWEGTNISGFSAVPTGRRNTGGFASSHLCLFGMPEQGFILRLAPGDLDFPPVAAYDNWAHAARCVKDPE